MAATVNIGESSWRELCSRIMLNQKQRYVLLRADASGLLGQSAQFLGSFYRVLAAAEADVNRAICMADNLQQRLSTAYAELGRVNQYCSDLEKKVEGLREELLKRKKLEPREDFEQQQVVLLDPKEINPLAKRRKEG
ncbi:MAG: hypothetical protein JXA94_02680 [Parachlamydiales bacterium]|nr:hypothetical protein [Parachlamydiales bacterium]